jgi:hypothetical protein
MVIPQLLARRALGADLALKCLDPVGECVDWRIAIRDSGWQLFGQCIAGDFQLLPGPPEGDLFLLQRLLLGVLVAQKGVAEQDHDDRDQAEREPDDPAQGR